MDIKKYFTREERSKYWSMTREEKKAFEKQKERELLKTTNKEVSFQHTIDDLKDMPPILGNENLGNSALNDDFSTVQTEETIRITPNKKMQETQRVVEEPEDSEIPIQEETFASSASNADEQSNYFEDSMFFSNAQKKNKRIEEHNHIYINTIWDATLSASEIFKPLYRAYEAGIREIQMLQNEYKNIVVKYGLTYLNTDVRTVQYQNGTSFTEDAEEFLQSIRHMKFAGGSWDGIENFNDAIEIGIRTIAEESEEHASRGIIYFTDSMTKDESPNFLELEDFPSNKKFRFVVGVANSNRYHVKCHVADANGNVTANSRNEGTVCMSMRDLFELGGIETITSMIHDIMNQVSVYV